MPAVVMSFSDKRRLNERAALMMEIIRPTGVMIEETAPHCYLIDGRFELNAVAGYWLDRATGRQGTGAANLLQAMSVELLVDLPPKSADLRANTTA